MIKGVSGTVENKVKEKKGEFIATLAAKFAANSLGSALTSKWVVRGYDGVIWAGEGIIRSGEGQDF